MNTYTRDAFIYKDLLESSTNSIKEDFDNVYGGISNLQIIKSPKQDKGSIAEWVGSFAYFAKRTPQWDTYCNTKSKFLKQLVNNIPKEHLQGIWFSAILPGGIIQWHTDKYDNNSNHIRVHLPLIVPEGDLGITVDKTTYQWKTGEVFCFDPFVVHTAWNRSNGIRLNANFNFAREAFIC